MQYNLLGGQSLCSHKRSYAEMFRLKSNIIHLHIFRLRLLFQNLPRYVLLRGREVLSTGRLHLIHIPRDLSTADLANHPRAMRRTFDLLQSQVDSWTIRLGAQLTMIHRRRL